MVDGVFPCKVISRFDLSHCNHNNPEFPHCPMVPFGLCRQKRHGFTALELKVIRGHPWSSELAGGDSLLVCYRGNGHIISALGHLTPYANDRAACYWL